MNRKTKEGKISICLLLWLKVFTIGIPKERLPQTNQTILPFLAKWTSDRLQDQKHVSEQDAVGARQDSSDGTNASIDGSVGLLSSSVHT